MKKLKKEWYSLHPASAREQETLAEIARLRGIIRKMARVGKENLDFTPAYMLEMDECDQLQDPRPFWRQALAWLWAAIKNPKGRVQ